MLSRRTARAIAEAYTSLFSHSYQQVIAGTIRYSGATQTYGPTVTQVDITRLYDFLFDHDLPAWLCNYSMNSAGLSVVKQLIMKLHTGESAPGGTATKPIEDKQREGQFLLLQLAEAILNDWGKTDRHPQATLSIQNVKEKIDDLQRSLELDGYLFRTGDFSRLKVKCLTLRRKRASSKRFTHPFGLQRRT